MTMAATGVMAQPKPSGTPDRPTATGTGSTQPGSPSMRPNPAAEPGQTGSAASQPPDAQPATGRTNGRQDLPRR